MDQVGSISNHSDINEHNIRLIYVTGIISESQRQIFQLVNFVLLCGLVSLFGMASNVINMAVFYKQGLDTTINISFFALAISDFCSLLVQQCFNIFANPKLQDSDVPIIFSEFQYLVAVPRECFSRITCLITVYITAERCLCIAFPLHVKQMITPKRTTIIIVIIYSVVLLSVVPLYCAVDINWKVYPGRNKTFLGLTFKSFRQDVEPIVFIIHAIMGAWSFLAVVIFTLVLIRKLAQKSTWLKNAKLGQDKSESVSSRDRKTMTIVTLIASILIICYAPSILLFTTTFFEPEFSVGGRYSNLYFATWSFGFLFESLNSSVNIFLYLKMSTKYRDNLYVLFSTCFQDGNAKQMHLTK